MDVDVSFYGDVENNQLAGDWVDRIGIGSDSHRTAAARSAVKTTPPFRTYRVAGTAVHRIPEDPAIGDSGPHRTGSIYRPALVACILFHFVQLFQDSLLASKLRQV